MIKSRKYKYEGANCKVMLGKWFFCEFVLVILGVFFGAIFMGSIISIVNKVVSKNIQLCIIMIGIKIMSL